MMVGLQSFAGMLTIARRHVLQWWLWQQSCGAGAPAADALPAWIPISQVSACANNFTSHAQPLAQCGAETCFWRLPSRNHLLSRRLLFKSALSHRGDAQCFLCGCRPPVRGCRVH